MTIEQISDITIKVSLSERDLQMYNISSLESNNSNTKLMLIELIAQVQTVINRRLNYEELFIEAFACSDGGCILYISTMDTELRPIKKSRVFSDILCEADKLEELISLSRHLQQHLNDHILCSELYHKNGLYRLILHTYAKSEEKLLSIVGEYSEILQSTSLARAVTREYYDCVMPQNAVDKIADLQA